MAWLYWLKHSMSNLHHLSVWTWCYVCRYLTREGTLPLFSSTSDFLCVCMWLIVRVQRYGSTCMITKYLCFAMFSCMLRWEILAPVTTRENFLIHITTGGNKFPQSGPCGLHLVRTPWISKLRETEFLTGWHAFPRPKFLLGDFLFCWYFCFLHCSPSLQLLCCCSYFPA